MAFVEYNFGCNVLRSASERPSLIGAYFFTEPKVNKLEISSAVEHQIFRFQIAINNVERVKMIECLDNAPDHKLGRRVVKVTSPLERSPDVTSQTYFHQEVDVL